MNTPRILCVQLNPAVDFASDATAVRPTHKIRTHGDAMYPGGGSINVARALHAFGDRPELVYLSGGDIGRLLDSLLAEIDISQHRIGIDGHTRLSYTVHELQSGQEYRFVPEGPRVSDTELALVSRAVESFNGDYLVLSGSLPPGAAEDTYTRLANIAQARGVRVVLDCSGAALRHTVNHARLHVLKPSFRELEHLAGEHLDEPQARRFCDSLVRSGQVAHVAVSMGAHGAFLVTRDGHFHAPALRVKVRSAVGAGDSFLAGMVHGLCSGQRIEQAFRLGIAAGAASVTTPGTALCQRSDVEALLPRCRVECVDDTPISP